jgi:hypothetical protein
MHSSLAITLYVVTFDSAVVSLQTKKGQKPLQTKPFSANHMKVSQEVPLFNINFGVFFPPKYTNIYLQIAPFG